MNGRLKRAPADLSVANAGRPHFTRALWLPVLPQDWRLAGEVFPLKGFQCNNT